eukprot:TRINITY_DN15563_c0_g1_i1.p1 TRINITY_DN15563_c0_g1~~TRINITY_DN15563_c0_g1_i1.p1  ORF type:complete len:407 (-),score=52.92 TRINITY_DN15563_c0_g1_i1:95-1315(-)
MTIVTKLKAVAHVVAFFVPFVLFKVLPVWFCQKFLKLGLRGETCVNEEFFSAIFEQHSDTPARVGRIIGRKSLLDGAKGMSNTLVDSYKLEIDGEKELNVVVKRPGSLAEAHNFGHFVEGVSLDPLMRTEYEILSKYSPKIKDERITPRFFGAYQNPSAAQIAIVMEHINPKKGKTDDIWTEEVFQIALRRIARHHATFWQNTHKDHPQFSPDSQMISMVHALCVLTLDKPEWKEWQADLSDEAKAFFHACMYKRAEIERKRQAATKSHSTLIHGDFHFGNVVIAETEDGSPDPRFVDWQLTTIGNPLVDLASLLASGSSLRKDPKFVQKMVKYYYDRLVEFGVSDMDWETCWLHFRWGFFRLHVWVMPIGVVRAAERKSDLSSMGVTQASISALIRDMRLMELIQ